MRDINGLPPIVDAEPLKLGYRLQKAANAVRRLQNICLYRYDISSTSPTFFIFAVRFFQMGSLKVAS